MQTANSLTFQDYVALGGLVMTAIGFVLVILQLRQIRSTIHTTAHAAVYQHGELFRSLMVEHADLRKYFFEGEPVVKGNKDANRIRSIAEIYANYLEHLFLSQRSLGQENRASVENFLQLAFRSSPILREVMNQRTCAYSEHFRDRVTEMLESEWQGCD